MTRSQLFTAVFFALLLLLLYQIALMFRPFLFPILWAALLAQVTFPLHDRLTRLFRGRPVLSASCLTVLVLALVVIPISLLGVLMVREAAAAEQAVRIWISGGGLQRLPEQLQSLPLFGWVFERVAGGNLLQADSMEQGLMAGATFVSRFLLDQAGDLLKNAFLLATDFLLMLFALFFLFKDGRRWLATLQDVIPMEASHKRKIFARLDQTVRAVVRGMFLTAIVQGVLAGCAYFSLGVPFPVVFTALTIILAPLPFGGTALIWGPVALYLLWSAPLWKAVMMVVWGFGIVSMVDQILRPWLIGQEVQIPVFLLVFSVLGGLALYGIIGLFIGPVFIGLLITAIQIYREEYHEAGTPPPASPAASS
ncbi:MAG TPA: AI-2E family transporter [Nitrospira sp.]|nr:AI-2E family transporter [Nitrospira sp.]